MWVYDNVVYHVAPRVSGSHSKRVHSTLCSPLGGDCEAAASFSHSVTFSLSGLLWMPWPVTCSICHSMCGFTHRFFEFLLFCSILNKRHVIYIESGHYLSPRSIFCQSPAPTIVWTSRPSPTCGWTPCRFGRWSALTCLCRPSTRLPWEWSVHCPYPCASTDTASNKKSQLTTHNSVIKDAVKHAWFSGTDTHTFPQCT